MAVSTMSISEDPYESLTSPDFHVYSTTSHDSSGAKSTVKSGKSSHPFRLAAVGLGLLCAILLTATITLCVIYTRERGLEMLNARNCKDYKGQLQRENITLSNEKNQLQRDYNQLQENFTRLSNEKDQLQRDYNSHIGQSRTCPEDWEQLSSKCYFFSYWNRKNWEDSHQYCKLHGAKLVIINSRKEQEFITQHTTKTFFWIGLKYSANRTLWEWVDGTLLQQAFWYPGQPSSGHCVCSGYTLQAWISHPCNGTWNCICETDASYV